MPRRTRTTLIAKGRCRDEQSGRQRPGDLPEAEKAARIADQTPSLNAFARWGW